MNDIEDFNRKRKCKLEGCELCEFEYGYCVVHSIAYKLNKMVGADNLEENMKPIKNN